MSLNYQPDVFQTVYGLTGDNLAWRSTIDITEATAKCGGSDILLIISPDYKTATLTWSSVEECAVGYPVYEVPATITLADGSKVYVNFTFVDRDSYEHMYVHPQEVAVYLGLERLSEDDYWRLVRIILEKMEYVDRITQASWNGRTRKWGQYYDMQKWKAGIIWFAGAPIHLQHRCIKEVTSFKIFRGTDYDEMITEFEEGRGSGDFWVDRVKGVLYWQHYWWFMGGKEFYIEYTYGCEELPPRVREFTLLLVARDVLVNERRMTQLPASDNLAVQQQLAYLERRIKELEGSLRAWRVYTD